MRDYVKSDNMNIKIVDRSKLIRVIETLSNKKNFIDPEEVKAINSINIKIDKLKNNTNHFMKKQTAINEQKDKIQTEIKNTFNSLRTRINEQLNQREEMLLHRLNDVINHKNTAIKNKINAYNVTLKTVNKLRHDTEILVDTAVDIKELNDRKLKVMANEKHIDEIINDNDNKYSKVVINDKLIFVLDAQNAVKFMEPLGVISEINVPILEQLKCDNDNGIINVVWSLCEIENANDKKNDERKISIEYGMIKDDNKEQDIDEKELKVKEVMISNNNNKNNENIAIKIGGVYLFKLRYFYDNIWSSYSNIKTISIQKINFPFGFDIYDKQRISVSTAGTLVTCLKGCYYTAITTNTSFNKGIHKWRIKRLDDLNQKGCGGCFYPGIISDIDNVFQMNGSVFTSDNMKFTRYAYILRGSIYSHGSQETVGNSCSVPWNGNPGDVITIVLNCNDWTLGMTPNDTMKDLRCLKIAPNQSYHPCIITCGCRGQFELLSVD